MVNRLHKEVEELKLQILGIVAEVEENLRLAVDALEKKDSSGASRVIDNDLMIDQMEVDFEEECLKVLALHQPVAADLRFIIAMLKINSDLERISDMAVNIAERARFLISARSVDVPFDFRGMADKVQDMIRRSINALVTMDVNVAYSVCASDDEVDALNRDMYGIVKDAIRKRPDDVEELIHFLEVSRHLERIADHATNIAEDVIYMIDGVIVRHHVEDYQALLRQRGEK